jgi:hypothetical protein
VSSELIAKDQPSSFSASGLGTGMGMVVVVADDIGVDIGVDDIEARPE